MQKARQPLPEELEQRILEILELGPDGREDLLAALCRERPEHAEAIQRRLAAMAKMRGRLDAELLAAGGEGTDSPERLGDFRILRRLGGGGMGVVHLAVQESLGRQVALKLIRPSLLEQSRARQRFRREMRAASGLDHPHISTVYEAGEIDGQPYIAMQYVEGEPLDQWIVQTHESGDGTTSRREVLAIAARFEKLALALHHAHDRGVLHRDVKPGNILVNRDGEPVLLDFGLARDEESTEAGLTVTGDTLGTPAYMSPEQVSPAGRDIDRRTDVYSLGAALYHALAGQPPFTGATSYDLSKSILHDDLVPLEKVNRNVPADLGVVVATAMEKQRNRRYRTAEDMAEDLRRVREFEPISARRAGPVLRARRWVQRHPLVSTLVLVLALAVAGVSWSLGLAQSRLHDFNALAMVEQLRGLDQQVDVLQPAGPGLVPELREWIERAEALVQGLPEIEATVARLRGIATPWSVAEMRRERRDHPDFPEWRRLTRQWETLQRAQDVRGGRAEPVEYAVGPARRNLAAGQLIMMARYLVTVHETVRPWGREAEALALARLALEKVRAGDESTNPLFVGVVLAWALHANGLDDEAVEQMQAAVDAAQPQGNDSVRKELQALQQSIAGAADALQTITAERDRLRESLRGWRLDDEADQFLHDTLTGLLQELQTFVAEDGALARMRTRLSWAERVHELTIERHRDRWQDATRAIHAADGETASTLYQAHPIELQPQPGLVPIGKNPLTGLWEFYDLRSAWDPASGQDPADIEIPTHRADGSIAVGENTGIVFVLVPGGTFWMGAQRTNPQGPNHDLGALANEKPHLVTLDPFFVARHEMSQGQWVRLSGEQNPSYNNAGRKRAGEELTLRNPVETVTWTECRELLERHGLVLPTEAQWEYSCRAGTTTPWWTGVERDSLIGTVNLADRTAKAVGMQWRCWLELEDGFIGHGPVDAFRANAWGLHNVHGNVAEWCADWYFPYSVSWRLGDGMRQIAGSTGPVHRGGGYHVNPTLARSAFRSQAGPTNSAWYLGLRCARPLEEER